jgi:hypothetical protein
VLALFDMREVITAAIPAESALLAAADPSLLTGVMASTKVSEKR